MSQRDGTPIALSLVMDPQQPTVSIPALADFRLAPAPDRTIRAVQAESMKATKMLVRSAAWGRRAELTVDELARVGVESLDEHNRLLRCMRCKAVWAGSLAPGEGLHPFYWRCANRCNW